MDRALYSIKETRARLGGISRSSLYAMLRAGDLPSVVIGCRRFVSAEAIAELISHSTTSISPSQDAARPARFSLAQIAHITRTVSRTPEVMVKVTGGGKRRGAVAAHFGYIGRRGDLEIETDQGERIRRPDEHKQLLDSWHLELIAGQYRRQGEDGPARRPTKLVHNIVLSMLAPTPADKVLAAARIFAREKFAEHRYAMVLHTDQKHPHVHLVVKAENELGRRLHIDKQRLREWREDFARLMREQGIAANATPRAIRGENKKKPRDEIFRAQRYGKPNALLERVTGIASECHVPEPSWIQRAKGFSRLANRWYQPG